MNGRSLLLIFLLVVTVAFAALNWGAFTTPTTLWLGFMAVEAPLGLVMLSLLAFVAVLFGAWVIYLQGSVMLDTRRHAKELHAQRELADRAEASRLAELNTFMTSEFQRLSKALDDSQRASSARLAEIEQRLATRIQEAANAVEASIGELDDRLERSQLAHAGTSPAAAVVARAAPGSSPPVTGTGVGL